MHSTMEPPTFTVATLPPPTLTRPKAPPNLVSQAPVLPLVVASVPQPATTTAMPFATSLNPAPPTRPAHKKSGGGGRRFLSWLVLLAAIGGIAFAAITYGPELMDRADGDTVDEPDAPMSFPIAAVAPAPIRTATYTVERTDANGSMSYTVTTDFESGLSHVSVDRGGAPDIELMAVFDEAVVRRGSDPTWYRLQRGDFPLEQSQGRLRFVRSLDELLPPALRALATIERSTESTVDNVPTRRLVLAIDPQRLAAAVAAPVVAPDTVADPSAPAPDVAPAPPAVLPPGIALAADADMSVPLKVEMWIDDTGLVRQLILPAALGGETIRVSAVSSEPLQATYPPPEQVQPLTANILLSLGG